MAVSMGVVAIGASAALVVPPAGNDAQSTDLWGGDGAVVLTGPLQNALLDRPALGAAKARPSNGRGAHFLVAPGQSGRSGPGKLQRFKVEVERGIRGISARNFAAEVEDRLMDHRSWGNKDGRALQRVSTGKADFSVTLTKPSTVDKMCYPRTTSGFVSCFMDGRAVINLQRWRQGAPDFSSLVKYRTYLINHEVGHGLAKQHWFCPPEGGPGQLMMQQTYMMSDKCSPQRFPRPNASKFKSKCVLSTHNRHGQLFVEGRVSDTPWAQKVALTHHDAHGRHTLGIVETTTTGRFSVPIAAGTLDSSAHAVSMTFRGTRDLRKCAAKAQLTPNA